ncbi:PREDICTED: WAS/WASL-interacting protein family member 1-like [Ceratosolen solmsi marchali]|uniref:WAS/WASL-interacting protein family member 1-like n=1 Tax=Ceratosolen solmsi marchali TaxID=326594 RepID=A0AAJ7DZE7_9HYME|nr:PREDICTED: WAS/WASL-interacting protein family member 1-like [Ceratosolen solmsi marchali]
MRMSSSMYEVFNWNCTPDPPLTPAKNKRASLSLPPMVDIFSIDDMSMVDDARRPMVHRGASGEDAESTLGEGNPSGGDNGSGVNGGGGGGGVGGGSSGGGGNGCCGTRYANRRRTDLMPTIPSPRDRDASAPTSGRSSSAKSFTRSPGRTYSMSRLDQLAQPRRRTVPLPQAEQQYQRQQQQSQQHQQHQQQSLAASSMSRSMSHLATAQAARGGPRQGPLKRTDNSRSMGTLPGVGVSTSVTRPTRAERLRRKAREHQSQAQLQQPTGVRSGEATPNSPSRPQSSMSQQSATSSVASSSVNLRPRTSTPRRPRPASIAGTGVTVTAERNSEHGFYYPTTPILPSPHTTNDAKAQKDSKPPLPKTHSVTKKSISSSMIKSSSAERKSDKFVTTPRSSRASPRATPKATPLQSPGVEQPGLIALDIKESKDRFENAKKEISNEKMQVSL